MPNPTSRNNLRKYFAPGSPPFPAQSLASFSLAFRKLASITEAALAVAAIKPHINKDVRIVLVDMIVKKRGTKTVNKPPRRV
jgi:hypothetical protein